MALLPLLGSAGCSEEPPAPVILEVRGEVRPSALWIWIKSEAGGVRRVQTPDGQPQEIVLPDGWDLGEAPYLVSLDPGSGAPSSLYIHMVGHQGGRAVGSADLRVSVGSGFVVRQVELLAWLPACDRDGDTFPDCGLGGCCDHLPADLRDAFGDCLDSPALAAAARDGDGCRAVSGTDEELARSAHPFRPASYGAGLAGCDDCIDQDCSSGDEACDFEDGDGDGSPPPYDCDDEDQRRYPSATELCNGLDDDCDGTTDEGFDRDRDGYKPCDGDCDDGDSTMHPGAEDICGDGIDQACVVPIGRPFEDDCPEEDLDGDGFPAGDGFLDCHDRDAGIFPGAPETCGDGVDQDCDGADAACLPGDADRDGHPDVASGGDDCDDDDPRRFPGAPERCGDEVDQDCDGQAPPCLDDGDGDGYEPGDGDCDSTDPHRHPWAPEVCNGIDDDCDGLVDEGNPRTLAGEAPAQSACYTGPPATRRIGICGDGELVCSRSSGPPAGLLCAGDALPGVEDCGNEGFDDDCNGVLDDVFARREACDSGLPGACQPGRLDCRDGELDCVAERSPEVDAACDGGDQDCDGVADNEEVGLPWHTRSCFRGAGQADVGICRSGTETCCHGLPDCADSGYSVTCRGQVTAGEERCDNEGADDDCNGVDDDVPTRFDSCDTGLVGSCRTGHNDCVDGALRCVQTVFPGAEVCDGIDNDCDGETDDVAQVGNQCNTNQPGPCAAGLRACVGNQLRCQPVVQPDPVEVCDGVDNDCDGPVDEGYQGQGRSCEVPGRPPGYCAEGSAACQGGHEVCVPLHQDAAGADADCDGVDDDCDGAADEDFATSQCNTGFLGRCRNGDLTCQPGGGTLCVQRNQSITEICDNQADDDCDGATDGDDPDC